MYKQSICVKNSSDVQKFQILIDNDVKCKSIGQINTARKQPESPVSNDNKCGTYIRQRFQSGSTR